MSSRTTIKTCMYTSSLHRAQLYSHRRACSSGSKPRALIIRPAGSERRPERTGDTWRGSLSLPRVEGVLGCRLELAWAWGLRSRQQGQQEADRGGVTPDPPRRCDGEAVAVAVAERSKLM